jgi:beta-mannosidase
VVNGKKFFVKGINWMPVDALYDLTEDKYDWAVRMAKNAGIQMFRIWGSGLLESKEFYDACDKYGIMVWQDFNIANFDTPDWPQEVWEAQVCQNIFRLRNRASLAVWCGGNEFNPYSYGNAASMGILERNLAIFDPTRSFLRTSPDAGSLHSYPDFDPVWYKGFDLVPYVSETGVHCITDAKNIHEVVDPSELKNLSGMYEKEFVTSHPEFVMHFAEYNPARVPRMLSRASHIDDMSKPTIEMIAEATQVGAGEFYQVMSEGIQSNYPVTVGLMPWVYKRPWPVVAAIHLVDGFGQPSATYYFLKRTYDPTHVLIDIKRLLWAPGEEFPVKAKVLNAVGQRGFAGKIEVRILDEQFKEVWKKEGAIQVSAGTSVSSTDLGTFLIPENYKEKIFFAVATFIR